jgi:hypothetical protein
VFYLKIATWHQSLPLQPRFQARRGAQIRRGEGGRQNVLKIVPKARDLRSFLCPFSGHFRADCNTRAQDRDECRCRRRGTPPRRDADCGSRWRFPRLRACAPPSISEWVDIWRIDGLLTQKLSEMGASCGKLQFSFHPFLFHTVRKSVAAGARVLRSKAVRRCVNEYSYGEEFARLI